MKTTNNLQTLIDDDTLAKLNRLIMLDALDKGEAPKGKSQWLRELIEDTVNFAPTLKRIQEYKPQRR